MTELISGCWILMELIAGYLFCGILMQPRKMTWGKLSLLFFLWLFLFLCTNYISLPIPTIFITTLVYLVVSFACYRGSWARHVVAVIMCILSLAIIDTLVIFSGATLLQINVEILSTEKHLYLTIVTMGKGISLVIAWICWRVQLSKNRWQIRVRWLLLTLLFPIVSLIMLVIVFDSIQESYDISGKTLGFIVAVSLGNVGVMYLIYQLENAERESLHSTLLSQQMEIQTKGILALEKSYRTQRKSAHEFNHHLQTLNTLLTTEQYEIAQQYICQLCEQQTIRIFSINSHHPIIDAILNQKYQLALENGIEMQVKVNDLSDISIPTDAIVVILSNLLDNAIEACSKCVSDPTIRFSMVFDKTLFLTIDNTSPPVSIVDGNIATSKANKDDHGYGLINVKRILNDLCAEFAFRYSDGWFFFVAEIPSK